MAFAEFEEREFETPLYNQLQRSKLVWSPGQVLEGHVGFDFAALSMDSRIWDLHGIAMPYNGVLLNELRMLWNLRRTRTPRALPNFELNLFLQAKRPEYLKRVAARLKQRGIKGNYWRFRVEEIQQQLLDSLARQVRGKGLVCYASPAFHRLSQLYSYTVSGVIVENSTFPDVLNLSGHSRWNYDQPGNVGVANIEPRYVEGEPLLERLISLGVGQASDDETDFVGNLRNLADKVIECVEQVSQSLEARKVLFFQRLYSIDNVMDDFELEDSEAIRSFLIVQAFCKSFGLLWFVIGRK